MANLKAVRTALNEMHRLLLSVLKKDRERIVGKVLLPAEWFQTLLGSPEYQWTKSLNSLLSDVDALSESEKISQVDLSIIRQELEGLFFKENGDVTSFNYHYRQTFAQNHDVMFAHGVLRQAYLALPTNILLPANIEEIRLSWHKISVSKRNRLN